MTAVTRRRTPGHPADPHRAHEPALAPEPGAAAGPGETAGPHRVGAGTPDDPAASTAGLFRTAFRRHPAGVAVITVPGLSRPAGFTATSVASLSLDPPLVSFGISGTASSWPHLRDSGTAVVHFLAAGQENLARRFATSGIDRFAPPTRFTTLPGGEPVLDGVATWLLADIDSLVPAGDHHIVICRVTHVQAGAPHRPLLYHDGDYHTL